MGTTRTNRAPRTLRGRWTRSIERVAVGGILGRQELDRTTALELASLYAGNLGRLSAELAGASAAARTAAARRAALMAGRRMARHYYSGATVDLVRSLVAAWVGLSALPSCGGSRRRFAA